MRTLFIIILLSSISLIGLSQEKIGIASYYHAKFDGRKTASGTIFKNNKMTAASNHYKLGEWVRVTNVASGKMVYVLINDRMAKNSNRLIDLTHLAAKELCFYGKGLCKVKVEAMPEMPEELMPKSEAIADTIPGNEH